MAGRRIRRALARITVAALALATPAVLAAPSASAVPGGSSTVFINEFHYDNASTDTGEFIEVAGPAGTDLSGWSIVLYNGSTPGAAVTYDTIPLAGLIPDQQGGYGTLAFPRAGIQNGGNDGFALVNGATVVQLLSYEGTFTASNGPAAGSVSTDVGVSQSGSEPVGSSVQLTGTGTTYADFTWTETEGAAANTQGAPNTGQTFGGGGPAGPVINEFVANHTGSDTSEYVEIKGAADTDYSAYSILQLEGDFSGTATGVIDTVHPLGTTNATGYWTTGFLSNALENGTSTLLLVEGFTGAAGDDLDANDDGTLDVAPWSALVDSVAVSDGGASDRTYSVTVLAPGFGGSAFTPGGASRIPDGVDTDTVSDWTLNDFDLAGIPGLTGTPAEGEALNTPGAPNALVEVEPPPPAVVKIHEIQGTGLSSPLLGQGATVEAVVTAVKPGLNGYYLQEEDADADADPQTSEGIFVFSSTTVGSVEVGDQVRVTGTVGEFTSSAGAGSSQTQLSNVTVDELAALVELPAVTQVDFPLVSTTELEWYEGMRVELVDELVISEYFNYDRFGEVVLAKPLEGQDRLHTPTAVVDPGASAQALAAEQALRIITLDDYNSSQNPAVIPHPGNGEPFSAENSFRGGDTVTGVVGVIDHTFGLYRIQPTEYGDYEAVNPRPTEAPDVGGSLQVASFNVLNYFLTLDDGTNDICGPSQTLECRGADSQEEFDRQRVKILEALEGLDADVVGLIEMENTPGVEPAADLVEGLNERMGAGTYDYIDTGVIGTDAIRLGFIYKPGTVTPIGDYAILDSSVDSRFNDDLNRPMLTQTFEEVATHARVTVSVNHLKSKGSDCNDVGDPDLGDGQGNCNVTRTLAAEAIADFLASDPTDSGDPDHLVIGDLNSYDEEDPITALLDEGYTDLVEEFGGEFAYGYVFDGKVGYLDHALSNEPLTPQVTGAAEWHINADEPDILDYNLDFGRPATYFEPNKYRSSDHDPVLVGLDLLGPADFVMDLRETLAGMDLQRGIENALDAKLRSTLSSLDDGDKIEACESLQSFINQVNALTGKKISAEDAEILIAAAVDIRRSLDC